MKRVATGGFTIVETMIVLAVSGVLFISLVGVIQGQQNKIQFKNSMTDIVSQIQSVIGQVSTGYYPVSGGSFTCQAGPSGADIVPRIRTSFDSGNAGTNDDCTFIGQAVMFGVCNFNDTEKYAIQTLVGLRRNPAGESPANFSEAEVRVMAPGASFNTASLPTDTQLIYGNVAKGTLATATDSASSKSQVSSNIFKPWSTFASVAPAPEDNGCGGLNPTGGTPNYAVVRSMAFGTTIKWMRYEGATNNAIPIAGLAVVTTPNAVANAGGTQESGATISNIIPIPCGTVPSCTSQGTDQAHGVDAITNAFEGVNGVNATARGMRLCFLSGSTNQSSLVRIGANGGNNSIEMTIHNNQDCV